MRRVASGIAGPVDRRARDLLLRDRLGGGCPLSGSADESKPPRSPEPAPRHYRHHPRVAVPSELTAEQLRTAPFFEPGRLEPCGEEDAATMSRQIRKRRAYPVGCAARCRHGFARAYLHAPLHAPAATALSFENTQSDESAPKASSSPGNETAPRTTDNTSRRSRSAKAKAALASPSGGARAEHALGWLACPLLDREVDKLERRGGIDAMAAVVANTPALEDALEAAHRSAPVVRRWMLPREWRERIEDGGDGFERARYVLFGTGLIGVSLDKETTYGQRREKDGWRGNRVKCLHAQLGDALVRGEGANPVGGLVLRRLKELGVETEGSAECWRECAARDDPRHNNT